MNIAFDTQTDINAWRIKCYLLSIFYLFSSRAQKRRTSSTCRWTWSKTHHCLIAFKSSPTWRCSAASVNTTARRVVPSRRPRSACASKSFPKYSLSTWRDSNSSACSTSSKSSHIGSFFLSSWGSSIRFVPLSIILSY